MTTWIDNPDGGRQRGLIGLAEAWIEVLIHPQRFFRHGIAPGNQALGLVFAVVVTLIHTATRLASAPFPFPSLETRSVSVLLLTLLMVGVFVTPIALHLVAALETALLVPLVTERAGVSQTVQVIAYAVAPCALSGITLTAHAGVLGVLTPLLWLITAVYGAVLLVIGTAVVHDTSIPRAMVVTALPSLLVFGYGFRGVHALQLLSSIGSGAIF